MVLQLGAAVVLLKRLSLGHAGCISAAGLPVVWAHLQHVNVSQTEG